ncbi:phenoloxidase subunit 1 isoform X2 [Leptidea sinapis]|uniref:phenoloxidase subunit 1 isoform X2 n=1 Tax=Leptidea sinapis TaxID=189913 RepID=UPI002140D59B|nr:phenoloxidase subunit 1 isoform X2 [Leptidea sinapis]
MSDAKKNLQLFFDRPTEPCFMQKGEKKAVFQLPDTYYPDKYKSASSTLADRFGSDATRTIPVRNIAMPNLSLPLQLPYHDQFSLWVPRHRQMAARLIDVFMGMRDLEDLQAVCSYCQLRMNPYLFNYCLSVAILHREDTKGVNIPTFAETFPDKFMDPKVFRQAREVSTTVTDGNRMPIVIPQNYTASEWDLEQRVAYFREDIGLNLHHWHWHLVYPFDASDRAIVAKDRRGELFYYMHQQIIARYSAERLCNDLGFPRRYNNFREPIEEGYFPKLDSQVASRAWPPRFAGSTIRDLDRPVDQIRSEVSELETWRDRFVEAINTLKVKLPNGREMALDEATGIDTLGNMMESSILSPNRQYYGDLHNMGHVFISYSHDPDHRNLEQFGVMGDSATAMRDPVFYRWHAYVDDLFQMYKSKLPPYTNDALDFPGIRVMSVGIQGGAGGRNVLSTQWEQSSVDLGRGLDFTPRGSVLARFTHLTHDNFNYVIEVNNTSGRGVMGTVRIFLAPTMDDAGNRLAFRDQRRLMIELDKFTQTIPAGTSTITRSSVDSSVTIPYERTFRRQADRPGEPGSAEAADFDFCGCGWPHHLLVPKGTPKGFPMLLFCMISNWNEDRVVQDTAGVCNDAASYCGLRDRKYPDKRAMGFPFDRPASASDIGSFLTPNMNVQECSIRFTNAVRQHGQQR